MRVILSLPFSDAALNDAIRQLPDAEIVKETPYYNATVLSAISAITPPPDVAIVGEALPQDSELGILEFVAGLRQSNIRVIFLADKSRPGDRLLADLVALNVTDIVLGGSVSMDTLARMLETQTPWARVSHLLNAGGQRAQVSHSVSAPSLPDVPRREVVVERIVEKVVEVQVEAPAKKVLALLGVGPDGAGVTTVASGLAVALADHAVKVALVDGDTRWPSLSNHYNLPFDHNGLGAVIAAAEPHTVGAKVRSNLWVYGSQVYPARPAALGLGESECLTLLDRLSATHDQVVLDLGYVIDHPFVKTGLRVANDVLLVMNMDPYRVVIASHELGRLSQVTSLSKFRLVVNGEDSSHQRLHAEDIATALERVPLAVSLPWTALATEAAAQCLPLLDVLPGNAEYTKGIWTLAGLGTIGPSKKRWWSFKW